MSESTGLQLAILEAALKEIIQQAKYFEERGGLSLANRWGQTVLATIGSLLDTPERDRSLPLPFNRLRPLRRVPVQDFQKYSIFYQIDLNSRVLTVIAVLHTSRDAARVLATPRN